MKKKIAKSQDPIAIEVQPYYSEYTGRSVDNLVLASVEICFTPSEIAGMLAPENKIFMINEDLSLPNDSLYYRTMNNNRSFVARPIGGNTTSDGGDHLFTNPQYDARGADYAKNIEIRDNNRTEYYVFLGTDVIQNEDSQELMVYFH